MLSTVLQLLALSGGQTIVSGKVAMSDDNAAAARTPADFLKSIKGKPVVVKLNSGVDYRGTAAVALAFVRCFSALVLQLNFQEYWLA